MKRDIVIIGGGPAGMITAITAKANHPDKSIVFIRKEERTLTPCGIPYIFSTLGTVEKDMVPDDPFLNKGLEIIIDEALDVNTKEKKIVLASKGELEYEKLVFATGSEPIRPKWLTGSDLENVFVIKKDHKYLQNVKDILKEQKKIAVIGAGFIGVEMSDELATDGKEVFLIEKLPYILGRAFDEDFTKDMQKTLSNKGINILTGSGVKELKGNGKVEKVILENGKEVEVDSVILSMGYAPQVSVAKKAGILITSTGGIWVDEYMRTSVEDVFAVGDCTQRINFITRRPTPTMLASTATSEARVAGSNLYNIQNLKAFNGTIAIFSTKVDGIVIGSAGATESEAKASDFEVITGDFEGMDRHPGTIPGAGKQKVKLVVAKRSGIIIGGQISGGESASELVNVLGFIIQNRMRVDEVYTSQIGTHPLTTSAPTKYPLIKAAEAAMMKNI
ncbi:MAG: pyridine nucleotide-disulfide oxidoreductase [Candidatus Muiribacterium halophilum]|uniref:Pyridine nucleotide-disulfide oxidoreductase n=1 Tax=Muiribacterium halophilum TaxID=2053465 RepID=A0A2N5ZLC8_MUIH1|nr:MAG: pyridine nucleotide-disulfide oxidoreductase [Candidatus Muirbacterium halophilum]